jgi:hypothetical protein
MGGNKLTEYLAIYDRFRSYKLPIIILVIDGFTIENMVGKNERQETARGLNSLIISAGLKLAHSTVA